MYSGKTKPLEPLDVPIVSHHDRENNSNSNNKVCGECIGTHLQKVEGLKYNQGENQNRRDYEWLDVLGHGRVKNVWFKEKGINEGEWTWYDDHWWEVHCKAISHGDDLYEDHMSAFVNPKTKIIDLLFHFEDGSLLPPTEEFYRLEQKYFDERRYCK